MCKDVGYLFFVDNDKLRLYNIIFTEILYDTYLLAKQHIKKIERKNSNICLIKKTKWETKITDGKQRRKSMWVDLNLIISIITPNLNRLNISIKRQMLRLH